MAIKPVELTVNCGYARVAIREISVEQKKITLEREECFKELFEGIPNFYNPSLFQKYGHRDSSFERNCKKIAHKFVLWRNREKKLTYLKTFSSTNWKLLPQYLKRQHTLTNCKECAIHYTSLQESFPGAHFRLPAKGLKNLIQDSNEGEATTTRKILAELQPMYQEKYGHTFTESLVNMPGSQLQPKLTDVEKKHHKRQIQRQCRDEMQAQFKQNDALTTLAEGMSLQSYKRIRLSQSFESPEAKKARYETNPPKERKHSPNFENVTWDKSKVLEDLRAWSNDTRINWSKFARDHDVPGRNNGQVVKEFAQQNGVDVEKLDHREPNTRMRCRKLRLTGNDISVPVHTTVQGIKDDWTNMITTGELTLGEQCNPYSITKYSTEGGEVTAKTTTVYGRKIPLLQIRQKLLKKHEQYMNLHTDHELANMNAEALQHQLLQRKIQVSQDMSEEAMRQTLIQSERTRTIALWHDHATLLGHGYVLVTAKIMYDPAVFINNSELPRISPVRDVQSYIEEPEVHILALSSSGIEDQSALIPDRLRCIETLNTELTSSKGVPVKDRLMFFCGDKPATQFERGAQQGGEFPCATCGCRDSCMDDLAHTLNLDWRNTKQLQTTAIQGAAGKKAGVLKPFESLHKKEIERELRQRNVFTSATKKDEFNRDLKQTLKGVQRVPTLLLNNPTQALEELNLEHYEILECEPLHDVKGHIKNLIEELPYLLNKTLRKECLKLLGADLAKEKLTGADYRRTAIHLLAFLRKNKVREKVCQLLETLVTISQIAYCREDVRSTATILRFYNQTWIHFELLKELIPEPKVISKRKLFGIYIHSLTVHGPPMLEILNLRSCNAEHEERLFGQAKNIATATSNRKPETIIPNILLRLQAKERRNDLYSSLQTSYSQISKEARGVEMYTSKNTIVTHEFIKARTTSWQAHLHRISHYLQLGEGKWWRELQEGYEFFDCDNPEMTPQIPLLTHSRDTNLQKIQKERVEKWKTIINDDIKLPTPFIRLYDDSGNYRGRKYYTTTDEDEDMHAAEDDQIHVHEETDTYEDMDNQGDHTTLDPQVHVHEGIQTHDDMDVQGESTHNPITQCTLNLQEILVNDDTDIQNHQSTYNSANDSEVDSFDHESCTNKMSHTDLQTKLATAIHKALPNITPELMELDKLRLKVKKTKNTTDIRLYRNILCTFKVSLKQKCADLQREIEECEQSYFIAHHSLPTVSETSYGSKLKQRNYIQRLLSTPDFV